MGGRFLYWMVYLKTFLWYALYMAVWVTLLYGVTRQGHHPVP